MPLHRWKGARSPRTIAVTALVGLALAAAACSSASELLDDDHVRFGLLDHPVRARSRSASATRPT